MEDKKIALSRVNVSPVLLLYKLIFKFFGLNKKIKNGLIKARVLNETGYKVKVEKNHIKLYAENLNYFFIDYNRIMAVSGSINQYSCYVEMFKDFYITH